MISDLLLDEPLPSAEDLPTPQAPRPPMLQPVADRLTAVWSLPVRNPAVTHFALIIRQVGSNDWLGIDALTLRPLKDNVIAFRSTQTSCYMEGLLPNKQYEACLAVKNFNGWSTFSQTSLVVFFPRFFRLVAHPPASQPLHQTTTSASASLPSAPARARDSPNYRVFLCIFKNGVKFRASPSFDDKTDSGVFGGETVRVTGIVQKDWLHCDNGLYLPLRLSSAQPLFEEVDTVVHSQSKPLFSDSTSASLSFSVDAIVVPLQSSPLKASPHRKILVSLPGGGGLAAAQQPSHSDKLLLIYQAKKLDCGEKEGEGRQVEQEQEKEQQSSSLVLPPSSSEKRLVGPPPPLPPLPSPSATPTKSIAVSLVRVAVTEQWGLLWGADRWGEGNRSVAHIETDSPISFWNAEHAALAVQTGDELVAVNGNSKDVHAALRGVGLSVDLVFSRTNDTGTGAERDGNLLGTERPKRKGQLRVTLDWSFSPPRVLEVVNGEDWGLGVGDRILSVNKEDITRVADPSDRVRLLDALENWRPLKLQIIKRKVLEEKGLKAMLAMERLAGTSEVCRVQVPRKSRPWGLFWDVGALRAHGLRIVESVDADSPVLGQVAIGSRLVSVNAQEDPSDIAAELRGGGGAESETVDLVFAKPCTGEVLVVSLTRNTREPWGVVTRRVPGSLAVEVAAITKDAVADRHSTSLRVGDQIVSVNENFRCEDMIRLLDDQLRQDVLVKVTRQGAFRTRQHLTGSYNVSTFSLPPGEKETSVQEPAAQAEADQEAEYEDSGEYCELPWCVSVSVRRESLGETWGWDPATTGRQVTSAPARESAFGTTLFVDDKVLSVNGKEKTAEMADELSRSVLAEIKIYRHKALVRTWAIELVTLTGRFGFQLDEDRRVREVQDEQPLWNWNLKYPHLAVKPGDTILSINGLSALYDMRMEMETKLKIALTLARCVDQAVKQKQTPPPLRTLVNQVPEIPHVETSHLQIPTTLVEHPAISHPAPPSAPAPTAASALSEVRASATAIASNDEDMMDPKSDGSKVASEYLAFLYGRATRFVTLAREEMSDRWGLSVEVQTGRVVGILTDSVADKHGGIKKFDRLLDTEQTIKQLRDPYLLQVRFLVTTDFQRIEETDGEGGRRMYQVELVRVADEPWGFAWNKDIFGTQGKRVIEAIISNTPAWRENDQCADQGRVVVAGDELVDVNRKQGFEAIGVEIGNAKRIKCVFAREVQPVATEQQNHQHM